MHPCAFRGHKSALTRAQRCLYLGAIVPFLRRFAYLANKKICLGILFSFFLIIENVCSGIYIKVCGGFWKNLYSVENFKLECVFTLHPFIFSPEMPINTGSLRMNGKIQPFITLHLFCRFLRKRLRIYTIVAFSFVRTFAP